MKLRTLPLLALLTAAAACRHEPARPRPARPATSRCEASAPRYRGGFTRARGGAPEVEAAWLARHRCEVRVVDVREADERAGELGHIEGSVHAPLGALERAAESWAKDEPVVLVCRSGRRSERAAATLEALGFSRVASMAGGMLAWNLHGLPVRRDPEDAAAPPREGPGEPPAVPGRATEASLTAALSQPGAIVWTRAATLLGSNTVSCIDGRAEAPVLGTPGGDAGELVLSLSALEAELGRPVTAAWIAALFDRYVESFGRFYVHTDHHALARLGAAVAADPRTARWAREVETPEATLAFLRAPAPEAEAALLDLVARPAHVGCGHLRMMTERPERYGVRAGLVADVLRAAFARGWRRPELLEVAVLDGEHEERGVLEVRIEHAVSAHTVVPMVVPHAGARELFVLHPQVAAFLRAENASFLVEHLDAAEARAVRPEALRAHIEALGERQLRATVSALAPHLPHFVLRASEGRHAVESVTRDVTP